MYDLLNLIMNITRVDMQIIYLTNDLRQNKKLIIETIEHSYSSPRDLLS